MVSRHFTNQCNEIWLKRWFSVLFLEALRRRGVLEECPSFTGCFRANCWQSGEKRKTQWSFRRRGVLRYPGHQRRIRRPKPWKSLLSSRTAYLCFPEVALVQRRLAAAWACSFLWPSGWLQDIEVGYLLSGPRWQYSGERKLSEKQRRVLFFFSANKNITETWFSLSEFTLHGFLTE